MASAEQHLDARRQMRFAQPSRRIRREESQHKIAAALLWVGWSSSLCSVTSGALPLSARVGDQRRERRFEAARLDWSPYLAERILPTVASAV